MRKERKSRKSLFIALSAAITLLIVAVSAGAYYTDLPNTGTEEEIFSADDTAMAEDLAAISGLDPETVLGLYGAAGDWDIVIENIFVYKEISARGGELGASAADILRLAAEYEPDAILTVFEYASDRSLSFGKAEDMLCKNKAGSELELVLSIEEGADASYRTYVPADEARIRAWLKERWLPADILSADAVARERDLALDYVLSLKTGDNTWEEIGRTLGIEPPEPAGTSGAEKAGGDSPKEAAQLQSEKAREKAREKENGIYTALREAGVDADKYLEQGFNIKEIENAARLSEASGADMETILAEKENGKTWPEIIDTYSREKGAPER